MGALINNAQFIIFAISESRRSLLIMPSEAIFSINERNRNLFIFPSEEKILLKKITNEVSNYKKGRVSEMKLDFFCLFSAEDSALRRLIKREFPQAEVVVDAGMHTSDNV